MKHLCPETQMSVEPPDSSQSFSVQPGDTMNFRNNMGSPIRIKVVTQCGTESEAELHPGAVFTLRAGKGSGGQIQVYILPPEAPFEGLQVVQ